MVTEIAPEYLTTTEAACYLSMSRQWFEIGRLRGYGPPYVKIGRAVRYKKSTLDDFMAARVRNHTVEV